jgi:glycosyltransferase involved in cell wall biosynthesis
MDREPEQGGELLVSVIIPARNAARTLQEALDALERQTLPRESYEVLVVDDRSTDETPALVRASNLARLVEMPRRGGSYSARNLGLEHSRAEVIAFTDADCRPVGDWLRQGLSDLDAHGADLLGGYIDVPLGADPSIPELLDVCWHLDQARFHQMGFAVTANLFVRRAVFDGVGGFHRKLTSNGDREFCSRAASRGFKLAYSPGAAIVHPPRTTARQTVRKGFRLGVGLAQTEIRARRAGEGARANLSRSGLMRSWLGFVKKIPRRLLVGPHVFGIHRVRSQGYEPSRMQLIMMQLAAYLLIDMPRTAGYLFGRVSARGSSVRVQKN